VYKTNVFACISYVLKNAEKELFELYPNQIISFVNIPRVGSGEDLALGEPIKIVLVHWTRVFCFNF
jgi:hypothetical protein